jgi:hypothetical protein
LQAPLSSAQLVGVHTVVELSVDAHWVGVPALHHGSVPPQLASLAQPHTKSPAPLETHLRLKVAPPPVQLVQLVVPQATSTLPQDAQVVPLQYAPVTHAAQWLVHEPPNAQGWHELSLERQYLPIEQSLSVMQPHLVPPAPLETHARLSVAMYLQSVQLLLTSLQ